MTLALGFSLFALIIWWPLTALEMAAVFGVMAALVLSGHGLINAWDYFRVRQLAHKRQAAEIESISAAEKFTRSVGRLSPEAQVEIVAKLAGSLIFDGWISKQGPVYRVSLGGVAITQDFIREYYNETTSTHTAPLRRWSDSMERRKAEAITKYALEEGYAVLETAANLPSGKWVDDGRERLMRALGVL